MSGDEKTHYEVLVVSPEASPEEIKKAARRLMQLHHPDRGGDPARAAQINAAQTVLCDPQQRAEYDELLRTGHPTSDAPPDPDSYEDSWGDEDTWDTDDDEEVLDAEVEEDPTPPQPATSPQDPGPAAQPAKPSAPEKPTVVRTAKRQALLVGLLPALVLLIAVFIESHLVTTPPDNPLLFPSVGAVVAGLALIVFRRHMPEYPGSMPATAAMTTSALLVAALAALAPQNPLVIPALQALIAAGTGLWVFTSGMTRHHHAAKIIASSGLREDGTLFGGSTGDTAGELLNNTIWKCLAQPSMRAARGFQTPDSTNPFTKAVLLGNRVALLRPLYLPRTAIPEHGPGFYWSAPSLFLRSNSTGVPVPVMRLELDDYRAAFRRVTGGLVVQEFLVIYTDPSAPHIDPPGEAPRMPLVVNGNEAGEHIKQFLTAGSRPVHHVDHQAAVKTLMGLEYSLSA